MTVFIDGYTGKYNGIDYIWKKQDDYAVFSFSYNGHNVAKRIKNVIDNPLDENIIQLISDMEIDYTMSQLETEKNILDTIARLKP